MLNYTKHISVKLIDYKMLSEARKLQGFFCFVLFLVYYITENYYI